MFKLASPRFTLRHVLQKRAAYALNTANALPVYAAGKSVEDHAARLRGLPEGTGQVAARVYTDNPGEFTGGAYTDPRTDMGEHILSARAGSARHMQERRALDAPRPPALEPYADPQAEKASLERFPALGNPGDLLAALRNGKYGPQKK